jgi:hypothetical protein
MTDSIVTSPQLSRPNLTTWLGYLGLIPFLVPLWKIIITVNDGLGIHAASLFGLYAPYIFITYSAIILSFLGGILWSKASLNAQSMTSRVAIVFSNIMALFAWASLIIINFSSMLTMLAVAVLLCGFGSLLLAERSLDVDTQDKPYWRMRLVLTSIVIASHALVLIFLIREF